MTSRKTPAANHGPTRRASWTSIWI